MNNVFDRSWPPPRETYCPKCCRMVEAETGSIPARHYRFNLGGTEGWPTAYRVCRANGYLASVFTHGQEDPRAAFRYLPEDQPTRSDIISAVNTDAVVTVTANITRGDN
jgi:hypothetical protein